MSLKINHSTTVTTVPQIQQNISGTIVSRHHHHFKLAPLMGVLSVAELRLVPGNTLQMSSSIKVRVLCAVNMTTYESKDKKWLITFRN